MLALTTSIPFATGCAVILCDFAGAGARVSSAEFDRLRALNFGFQFYDAVQLYAKDQPVSALKVWKGTEKTVNAVLVIDSVRLDEEVSPSMAFQVHEGGLNAMTATAGGVEVTVPSQAPDAIASVVVLEIEAKPGSPAATMDPKVQ